MFPIYRTLAGATERSVDHGVPDLWTCRIATKSIHARPPIYPDIGEGMVKDLANSFHVSVNWLFSRGQTMIDKQYCPEMSST